MQGIIYLESEKETLSSSNEKLGNTDASAAEVPFQPSHPQNNVPQSNSTNNLNPAMKGYIESYKEILAKEHISPVNPIFVDEIVSKIAKFYEKLRRVIDWKEENLVRRTSIERILKRRLISEISGISIMPDLDPKKIAGPMTLEIIRTGYFENGKISEEKIHNIEKILEKYLYILKNSPHAKENALALKIKVQFYNWILEIAACEIEETLETGNKETLLIDFMTESIYGNLKVLPEDRLDDEDKYIQIYIATHKALFGLDKSIIVYRILKKRYPQFTQNDPEFVQEFTAKIDEIWKQSNEDLSYPKRGEFQKICEKYDAAYTIISDVMKDLEKDGENMERRILNKETFRSLIEQAYRKRLETLKKRLFRSAIYSTLSIFVAGAVSLFIFEYPVAKFFYGKFSPLALVADIAIPTILMFLLVGIIKPPKEENLAALIEEVLKVTHYNENKTPYLIKLNKKVKKVMQFIFSLFYLLGGLFSLYFIYWIFKIAGTPLTSLYINTANVAIIVFAAMAIRQKSKEITIEERGSIIEFFLDFFSIPLAKIGGWISSKWKEFNFVSVFFSTLVDTPFSSFIELLEGWRAYIKDKQAEIQ